jgi:ABC-type uncharacterized transport system permease subunit
MPNILLHLLAASFYLALGILVHRKSIPEKWEQGSLRFLLLVALGTHAMTLGAAMSGAGGLRFGLFIALSLSLWMAMLMYGLESLLTPLKQILGYAAPAAAVAALLPALELGHPQTMNIGNWAFRLHIVVAMLAYSLFTLAVFHALLLATAERRIHKATLPADGTLPPLLVLERLLFRLILAAFVFLTLTVGSGLVFSEEIFGKPFVFSHKAVFGVASWLLFAILLAGRSLHGWRGKTATRWLLAGFVCLILAYAGTRFVLEIILQRSV